ncbi:RNA-directed DNA polymerase [Lichenicola cladoniae]|uniref:RNA-directed DNA polymerase n=2 Tax=Lichenicola cladoniae TaxID=1484109 RepID=A0A6M8HNU8_9PROT|nr:RNA-directed DNA polymerase [Acetobacteraceae bacterium]QKE89951.1 RNA-directed DNA polymerase [Lichenicola cladoniae]
MKSPNFDTRSAPLRTIFSPSNLEKIWTTKVRVYMRQQFLNDGIEHLDFHVARKAECQKLSRLILAGDYVPERAQRILVEKSKGLCRQLVIPSVKDAIVLQCLSDALYTEVKGKEPTKCAFFEPKNHKFSIQKSQYGSIPAWLNFQRELFNFSANRNYIVVTDISNYYDSISYTHLRNVISAISGVEECVLDMLIHVLSSLLWQPDYMPRVEIGLPQMNLDAPRLLAHCFLYELDKFLASDPNRDFVRFMDDIDVGVDRISDAKQVLKAMDLVLQTKQVRLNSGKTLILRKDAAAKHFRIFQNSQLDKLTENIALKVASGKQITVEVARIEKAVSSGLAKKSFDHGNGDKVLKRWINLAAKTGAILDTEDLKRVFLNRPSVRENVCSYIMRSDFSISLAKMAAECARSPLLVDDAGRVDLVNYLLEALVPRKGKRHDHIMRVQAACDVQTYFGLYCKMWLQSKYDTTQALLDTIQATQALWASHERMGRLVGSFSPLFADIAEKSSYYTLINQAVNHGVRDVSRFHDALANDPNVFNSMYDSLKATNPSRGTGITHPKFLCLLSALKNKAVPPTQIATLKNNHVLAWKDAYYSDIAKRLSI